MAFVLAHAAEIWMALLVFAACVATALNHGYQAYLRRQRKRRSLHGRDLPPDGLVETWCARPGEYRIVKGPVRWAELVADDEGGDA